MIESLGRRARRRRASGFCSTSRALGAGLFPSWNRSTSTAGEAAGRRL